MKRPYKVIVSDNPHRPLGESQVSHSVSMADAADAFARSDAPFKQIIYDNGCVPRELNGREQRPLYRVCELVGLEPVEVGS